MENILKKLSAPLSKEDVELRVGSNSANSSTLLLYKTARTDMHRLNDVCGAYWSNSHKNDDNGNVCCIIAIYDEPNKQWITRQDVGTESNTEKEKGSYSDSFKRAGTRWGIGLELYNTDTIRIMWDMEEDKKKSTQYKNAYKPVKFFSNNLKLTKYQVVDGRPQVEIKYDGKVVFTNIKGSIQPEKPMNITPHTPEAIADTFLMAERDLNKCTTMEELEKCKVLMREIANRFKKRNDQKSLDKLAKLVEDKTEQLKGE